jgi:hypothetical protein
LSDTEGTTLAARSTAVAIFVAVAAAVYAVAAIGSLLHPFNHGSDRIWAGATLALGAIAAIPRWDRMIVPLVVEGELAVVVLIAILSGRFPALLVAAVILIVAHALGATILDAAGLGADSRLEKAVLAVALGITLMALAFLALAAARVLYRGSLCLAMAVFALVSRRELGRQVTARRSWNPFREPAAPPSLGTRTAVLVGGYLFILAFLWAVAPEVQFDALNYHLVVPRDYLAMHRIVRPMTDGMYLAHLTEAFFGFGMGLGGGGVPKLLALATGSVATLAVMAIGRRLAGPEAGIWSALLFAATPLVHWSAATAYGDLGVTMLLAASVLALLRIRSERTSAGFVLCAWLAGSAAGAKLNALFSAPVLAFAAVLELRARSRGRSKVAIFLCGGVAAFLAIASWHAVSYAFTGSPLYPIGVGDLGGKDAADAANPYARFGIGHSWKSAAMTIPTLTFRTGRFGEALPEGALGLVVLLVVLLAVALAFGRRPTRIVAAIALAHAACWWATRQYGRYLVPAIALALPAILAVCPWRRLAPRRLLRIALSAGVLAQALVIPVEYWNIPERFPLAVASGGESSRHFLERVLPPYRALEWLNGAVKPGEKVAAFGVEGIRYYCRVPMGCANDTKDLGRIVTLTDPEEIGRRLDAGGYGWLIRRAGPDAGLPADFVYFASTADRQTPADRRSSGGRDFAAALPLLVA